MPAETLPNRAFARAGTSQGDMDDKTHTFTSPSIFGLLESHGVPRGIYGYDAQPLTKGHVHRYQRGPCQRLTVSRPPCWPVSGPLSGPLS